mgnify:CR=1 FL=1
MRVSNFKLRASIIIARNLEIRVRVQTLFHLPLLGRGRNRWQAMRALRVRVRGQPS